MKIEFKHSLDPQGRDVWDASVLLTSLVIYPDREHTFTALVCGHHVLDTDPRVEHGLPTLAAAQQRAIDLALKLHALAIHRLAGAKVVTTTPSFVAATSPELASALAALDGCDADCVLSRRHDGPCSTTYANAEVGH